jgi:hypothetical protein
MQNIIAQSGGSRLDTLAANRRINLILEGKARWQTIESTKIKQST